ncbi:hypothetical protein [Rhizobium sp. BK176]|uniref:hypothetical protein n=1 Tax=Rhizobium sp. BK176 TaxID=2587071 RepID=UPI002167278B|nr:hypothetical protein [Rhizobium sp. BK176]MCS4089146.1 hypothetical protein [Rhizobium sp. BK176]
MEPNPKLYKLLTEACDEVGQTLQEGDEEKWLAYVAMDSDTALDWRREIGIAEFARLQRLAFHSHIRGGVPTSFPQKTVKGPIRRFVDRVRGTRTSGE